MTSGSEPDVFVCREVIGSISTLFSICESRGMRSHLTRLKVTSYHRLVLRQPSSAAGQVGASPRHLMRRGNGRGSADEYGNSSSANRKHGLVVSALGL